MKPPSSALLLLLRRRLRRPAIVMALLRAAPPMRRAPKASNMKNWPSIQMPHLKEREEGRRDSDFCARLRGFSWTSSECMNQNESWRKNGCQTCSGGSACRSKRCSGRGPRRRSLRRPPPHAHRVCQPSRPSLTIGDLSLEAMSCDYDVFMYTAFFPVCLQFVVLFHLSCRQDR